MERFLYQLPKWAFALGGIILGLLLVLLFNPPKTACDTQKDLFLEAHAKHIIDGKKGEVIYPSALRRDLALCRSSGSPGGCGELFRKMSVYMSELRSYSVDCAPKFKAIKEPFEVSTQTYKIMIFLAWGAQGAQHLEAKRGWYEHNEVRLFCDLKTFLGMNLGPSALLKLEDETLKVLPGSPGLSLNDRRERSILSLRCPQR